MRIFNSDGSEPEMCGNGIRCLARFVAERDAATANGQPVQQRIHTLAGVGTTPPSSVHHHSALCHAAASLQRKPTC